MKLKRLELQGFKSFKDKTVIHFGDGMTGIVGPNGCGKSNVVDAFFWVMGEMSPKHLRGASMQDVIFSGSTKYQGADFAEVNLTIEAEVPSKVPGVFEPQEMTITRKLTREGESHYLLNNSPVRLKDIQELLMDFGVGNKSYSIIEQGQIARVVASKPEDRRVMIEELAGVMKFKVRKKESLRKLESTQQNMERLEDILQELQTREGQLERQSKKAIKARAIRNELKERDLKASSQKYFELKQELDSLEPIVTEAKASVAEALIELDQKGIEVERLRNELSIESQGLEEKRLNLLSVSEEKNNLRRLLDRLETSMEHLRSKQAWLKSELHRNETEFQVAKDERDSQEKTLDDLRPARETYQESLHKFDEQLKTLDEEIQKLRAQHHQKEQRYQEQKNELTSLDNKNNELQFKVEMLRETCHEQEAEFSLVSKEKEAIQAKISEIQSRILASQSSKEELETKVTASEQEKTQIELELKSARETYRTLQTEEIQHQGKVDVIESLLKSRSAFKETTKAVLEKHPQASTLIEKISVDSGYEVAVKSALGLFEEALVNCPEDLQADSHCYFLGQSPKATEATSNSLRNFVRSEDSLIQNFIDNYLGQFVMVEEFSADNTHHQVKKDGSTFYSFGIQGRGAHVGINILQEKHQLEALKASLTWAQARVQHQEKTIEGLESQLEALTEALKADRASLEVSRSEVRDLNVQAQSFERELNLAKQKETSITHKLNTSKHSQEQFERDREINLEQVRYLQQECEELEKTITTLKTSLDENLLQQQNIVEEKHRLQLQEASRMTQIESLERNLKRLASDIEDYEIRIQDCERDLSNIEQELSQKTIELSDITTSFSMVEEFEKEVHGLYTSAKDSTDQISLTLNGEMDRLSEIQAKERELNKTIHEGDLKLQKLRIDEESLRRYFYEKYEIESYQITMPENPFSHEDLAKELSEVEGLKESLRRLGDINYTAIEEYEQIQARVKFITEERSDLEKSIQQLRAAIERIEELTADRFRKTFDAVSEKFHRVFPVIFGGGAGKLVLTPATEDSEEGVDIIAQPPGKKMTNISLMSGGEKAMTAVSLIFAMFLVKPSPFCLLDEVDAPLDDRNVDRFNEMIKGLADKSQFIVITHNKRTMEFQENLYGVTMQEPGVSRLMSVSLQ